MDEISEFLLSPRKKGVFLKRYVINLNTLKDLFNFLSEQNSSIVSTQVVKSWTSSFDAIFNTEDEKRLDFRLNLRISACLAYLLMLNLDQELIDCLQIPEDHIKEILETEDRPMEKRRDIERYTRGHFRSKIYGDVYDVLTIEKKISKEEKIIVLEIMSVKNIGVNRFENFLSKVPGFNSYELITDRKCYSERCISKVYPYAITLLINQDARFLLRDDLKNFINAAIKYYHSGEWRTSIVLCSIAVESIMAELYEEHYNKEAPDKPLGSLIKSVEQKVRFPINVRDEVMSLNKARISSVHRTKNPISNKEAIISLRGITHLSLWFLDNY